MNNSSCPSKSTLGFVKARFGRETIYRWLRYGIIGASTAVAYYLLSILLVLVFKLPIALAGPLSYIITHPLAFLSHSFFTYRAKPTWSRYVKYWGGSFFTFCVTGSLSFFGQKLNLGIQNTSLIVIVVTPLTQILANELFTFRRKK